MPARVVFRAASDKIGVYQGEESFLVRRGSAVDYWDGEPPG